MYRFRAMPRTILDEVLEFRLDFIEHQLAHAVRDSNGGAYNRTAFLPERSRMMQVWADYLDRLKAGEETEAAASQHLGVLALRRAHFPTPVSKSNGRSTSVHRQGLFERVSPWHCTAVDREATEHPTPERYAASQQPAVS